MTRVGGRWVFVVALVGSFLSSIVLAGSVDPARARRAADAFLAGRFGQVGQASNGTIRAQAAAVTPAGLRTIRNDDGTILATVPIQNNIVWQNGICVAEDVVEREYAIRYNDIQGGWSGTGNLDVDPLFADAVWVVDEVTSPCIDAGNPATSYSKEPQPNGGRVNMGVYGGTDQASKSW